MLTLPLHPGHGAPRAAASSSPERQGSPRYIRQSLCPVPRWRSAILQGILLLHATGLTLEDVGPREW